MKAYIFTTGLRLLALLGAISGAVYYKIQASDYEHRWGEAMDQLESALRIPKQFQSLPAAPVIIADNPTDQEKQIITLLTDLQKKDDLIARLTARTNGSVRAGGFEQQSRLEEMKTTDPKQYEELMARREAFRQNVQNTFAQKAATLLDRDVSARNKEELAQYELMLKALDETWKLTEKLMSPDLSQEDRREVRQELTQKTQELQPLLRDERNKQFYELGKASGYSDTEAQAFADYINATIQATSLPSGGRSRNGPPPDGNRQ